VSQLFRSLTVLAQSVWHCSTRSYSAPGSYTDGKALTYHDRDDRWVDDLFSGNQGGVNGGEGRTFLELGGGDCG
jgi:hypothetical protein